MVRRSVSAFIPPSPDVMMDLFRAFKRLGIKGLSFQDYLKAIGFRNPAEGHVGMDDGHSVRIGPVGQPELIAIPSQPIVGELNIVVLLVDFEDRPGSLTREHYQDLLFSERTYPTGSMRDYFREVTLGKVNVNGTVHGWLRMPQKYSDYTNKESGTEWNSYPRNAPRLAEDAVRTALQSGVPFNSNLDKLGNGQITALFIIHAGFGAEVIRDQNQRKREIWSHKWTMRHPVTISPSLTANLYLTVPHDCKVGVCAHELGHLAFQWQDFYDPNYDEDGSEWDGSGVWDLMAGGSYNGNSNTPAHPAGLHKLQHGWVSERKITSSATVSIKPYTPTTGEVVRVLGPNYRPGQYLLLENRVRAGFDYALPGEGLLVWRVDESKEQFAPAAPGMLLLQADGRHDLEKPGDWNQGDAGDPFPGSSGTAQLLDQGSLSTTFASSLNRVGCPLLV